MNILQRIRVLGFQAFAKDAKPEEMRRSTAATGLHVAVDEKKEEMQIVANKNGHKKLVRVGVLRDGTPVFD